MNRSYTETSTVFDGGIEMPENVNKLGYQKIPTTVEFSSSTGELRYQPEDQNKNASNNRAPKNRQQQPLNTGSSISFEVVAYEALLSTVKDLITVEFEYLQKEAQKILAFFREGAMVSPNVQEKLRALKDKIQRLASKLKNYRLSLDDIIEDDETMALMNVTSLALDSSLYEYGLI